MQRTAIPAANPPIPAPRAVAPRARLLREERKATAIHEAAHACAALVFNLPFATVAIHPTNPTSGILKPLPCTRKITFREYTIVHLCGPLAESLFLEIPIEEMLLRFGSSDDCMMARQALPEDKYTPLQRAALWDRMIADTSEFVVENWEDITVLADALLQHFALTSEQAQAVVRGESW